MGIGTMERTFHNWSEVTFSKLLSRHKLALLKADLGGGGESFFRTVEKTFLIWVFGPVWWTASNILFGFHHRIKVKASFIDSTIPSQTPPPPHILNMSKKKESL